MAPPPAVDVISPDPKLTFQPLESKELEPVAVLGPAAPPAPPVMLGIGVAAMV